MKCRPLVFGMVTVSATVFVYLLPLHHTTKEVDTGVMVKTRVALVNDMVDSVRSWKPIGSLLGL